LSLNDAITEAMVTRGWLTAHGLPGRRYRWTAENLEAQVRARGGLVSSIILDAEHLQQLGR